MIQTDERVIDSEELLRKIRIKVLDKGIETNEFFNNTSSMSRSAIEARIVRDLAVMDQTWSLQDSEIQAGFLRRCVKRLIRKTVYWLIRPYFDQQSAYNAAATRVIEDMHKIISKK